MKKYLYFVPPLAKWFTNTLVIIAIFSFVFPVPIAPWVDLVIGWTLSAIIAAPFAYWAFKTKLPTDKELGAFILSWVAVTLIMETIIALIYQPNPWMVLFRYEFLVQTILEITAILVMARVMRRQNAYHMAAPGIDLDEPDIA
ncbi:MAG: hypothetical protein P1P90_06280 [Patescibacteria group bacterium]|nr:hypothetical protein [Patescibacteria group bacterium]